MLAHQQLGTYFIAVRGLFLLFVCSCCFALLFLLCFGLCFGFYLLCVWFPFLVVWRIWRCEELLLLSLLLLCTDGCPMTIFTNRFCSPLGSFLYPSHIPSSQSLDHWTSGLLHFLDSNTLLSQRQSCVSSLGPSPFFSEFVGGPFLPCPPLVSLVFVFVSG